MYNLQVYFYYFQWQTTPLQTCSSTSRQYYSQHIVSFSTLMFQSLYFVFIYNKINLATKSAMLLIYKMSFLGKYVKKYTLCGSPLQRSLSFYSSLSVKSDSAPEAEKVPPFCFLNSPASCSHT